VQPFFASGTCAERPYFFGLLLDSRCSHFDICLLCDVECSTAEGLTACAISPPWHQMPGSASKICLS
jgi:hypothetical protein